MKWFLNKRCVICIAQNYHLELICLKMSSAGLLIIARFSTNWYEFTKEKASFNNKDDLSTFRTSAAKFKKDLYSSCWQLSCQ